MSEPTAPRSITTPNGTTVSLEQVDGETRVFLTASDMPRIEAGRLVYDGKGFQPAPFAAVALRPTALRAIADLMETPND